MSVVFSPSSATTPGVTSEPIAIVLEQCHPDHVDQRVREADHREEDEHEHEVRPERDERDREAPEEDTDPEVACQTLPAGECGDGQDPEHAADADGGVEPAHAGVARVEEAERDEHEQDLERAGDERLRARQADDDA